MERLPTLFISHGSPMCALAGNPFAGAWRTLAGELPRPRALLIATAHWEATQPAVGSARRPAMIYDFGGFPPALHRVRYPAPGSPALAERAAELLGQAGVAAVADEDRGLDHGTWVPLVHMYPEADLPVVQLSVNPSLGAAHHLQVGAALAPLVSEGVLVIGSGALTHNLGDWSRFVRTNGLEPSIQPALPYVEEFCEAIDGALQRDDLDFLAHFRERAPSAHRAHPSEEHFLPLLVAYAAAGPSPGVERIELGVDGGAIAMDMFRFRPAAH